MVKEIIVGKKKIGGNNPCFIVAEVGINHNGRLDIAKKLIDVAAEAGCDAVKFQAFTAKRLYPKSAGALDWQDNEKKYSYNIYDRAKSFEIPMQWIPKLIKYCKEKDVTFFASVSDESTADLYSKYQLPLFKTNSYSITNLPLLEHIAKKKIPIVISTGGARIEEIKEAYNILRRHHNKIIILHCIIRYPTPLKMINMNNMDILKKQFPEAIIGYSDHSAQPIDAPLAAIYKGAKVIEKHITLDKNMKGPDHFFALEPKELKKMVKSIRNAEERLKKGYELKVNKVILGSTRKKIQKEERYLRDFAYGCIFASKKIKKGEILTKDNIIILRPGKKKRGLEPENYWNLIKNRYVAKRDISAEEPIEWQIVKKLR